MEFRHLGVRQWPAQAGGEDLDQGLRVRGAEMLPFTSMGSNKAEEGGRDETTLKN